MGSRPATTQRSATYLPAEVGILTKTVIQTPVIRYILHARIRARHLNDVVFVGDDFVHVKQVKEHGQLLQVKTHDRFGARIRAARVFSNELDRPDEEFFIKTEDDQVLRARRSIPPQFLVLTLDINEILFLYLREKEGGDYEFESQSCPMPTFDRMLFQPGEHLAIDPRYRALAVAANEKEIVIYSTKAPEQVSREMEAKNPDWCPIAAQRPIQVEGAIQLMDFLLPSREDDDHVILLLITILDKRAKAVLVEWNYTADLHDARIQPAQPLDSLQGIPNLLIPLRNAAFLLAYGSELTLYENILSGFVRERAVASAMDKVEYPGASPRQPIWTSWCRPLRGHSAAQAKDYLYLAREDGHIFLVDIAGTVVTSHAADFECHIGAAFASLGDSRNPDILAAAGDMSPGRIVTIGTWFSPTGVEELSRLDTMHPDLIESIPNWASVTDMVTTTLRDKSRRTRDGIFVTSGRQPHGCVTELRRGLEAQIQLCTPLDSPVTSIWALPLIPTGEALLLLSSPTGTQAWKFSVVDGDEVLENLNGPQVILNLAQPTLAAGVAFDGRIVQVTATSLRIQSGVETNFEDSLQQDPSEGRSVVTAEINDAFSMIVTGERSRDEDGHSLAVYSLPDTGFISQSLNRRDVYTSKHAILAMASCTRERLLFVAVSMADGYIRLFSVQSAGATVLCTHFKPPPAPEEQGLCDSLVILRPPDAPKSDDILLVMCGLRDGRIFLVLIRCEKDAAVVIDEFIIVLSHSNVKLSKPPANGSIAYAMSESEFCCLSWDGSKVLSSVSINSIWMSNKAKPHLGQGPVEACTRMPAADLLSLPGYADTLVCVASDEVTFSFLDSSPITVPRRISVSGTPNRLLYAEQHRSLVCASLRFGLRNNVNASPSAPRQGRRSVWPVIDFIPSRSDHSSYSHHMQPGERVYALMEWTYKPEDHNRYSFVLIGGTRLRSSGEERGRITFLQASIKSWEIVGVKESFSLSFDHAVYAIALFDAMTLVVCAGRCVLVHRFSVDKRRWILLCESPPLASIGSYISVQNPCIYISTLEDSLVVLRLETSKDDTGETVYDLVPDSLAPRADTLLSHLAPVRYANEVYAASDQLALLTTKYGQVIGLRLSDNTPSTSCQLVFEARLLRSLTRLRQCNVRPLWKRAPGTGVLTNDIIGCAPDGTIVGIALLDQRLLRQLSWLQRLCESSLEHAEHTRLSSAVNNDHDLYNKERRGVAVGLRGDGNSVLLPVDGTFQADRHVDGDVLDRFLGHGGVEDLKNMIRQAAQKKDAAGLWINAHLQDELEAAGDIFETMRSLLDSWI